MRVMLVAIGSTGDVAPYLGVAHELRQRGHEVCVATHGSSRSWVEEVGCAFALHPTEPRELMTEELQARLRRGGLRSRRKPVPAVPR